jgi:O-methyltransferase
VSAVIQKPQNQATTPRELYLDLLKRSLTGQLFGRKYRTHEPAGKLRGALARSIRKAARACGYRLEQVRPVDPQKAYEGRSYPPEGAETMIGFPRLDNIQECIVRILEEGVPGDLIETGVWRGGATIFMRGVLKAYGETERTVWAADSFRGLPRPSEEEYPADRGSRFWRSRSLRIGEEIVKDNFRRYGLLDSQVRFLPGWFSETLPGAPIETLALLRLDGDMYESTMVALRALYPKLSVGGYVIVDDYHLDSCREAVADFRREHSITDAIEKIDWTGVYWRRGS